MDTHAHLPPTVAIATDDLPRVPDPIGPHIVAEAAVRDILGEIFDCLPLNICRQLVDKYHESLLDADQYVAVRRSLRALQKSIDAIGKDFLLLPPDYIEQIVKSAVGESS
ncbi:hypothetical protein [Methylocaldum gracile]|jgi:hypothetical protein|uniref:hypothetical protein n=1 Tax=Methylocaldum sp. 0917 TaxID=2485163 RepID=UPI00105E4390